jgi:hypothetical protein
MLINKFQCRQKKARGREEWAQCSEGHWRCPFFKYCGEEGIKLPTAEICPECNGAYNNNSSSKRVCFKIEDLQLRITVNLAINGSQSMIG